MRSCRKPVYKTMCESDKGQRTGRYGDIRYESVAKRNSPSKTKGTAKAVPKATAKTVRKTAPKTVPKATAKSKKEEIIWKSMDSRVFLDDAPYIVIEPEAEDEYEDRMRSMYRDEQLKKAYTARKVTKRKNSPSRMMKNLERIGKKWESRTGEIRYYINDWKRMIGLKISYYKTGNVSDVKLQGNQRSNHWYKKYVQNTKVWVGTDGKIHIDYCQDDEVEGMITKAVKTELAKGVNES